MSTVQDIKPVKKSRGCLKGFLVLLALFVCAFVAFAVFAVNTVNYTPASGTPVPVLSAAQIQALVVDIAYDDLARNTEQHIGKIVRFRGKVVQVMEIGERFEMRVDLNNPDGEFNFDDVIYVHYQGPRVLEDDQVLIYGRVEGRKRYTTVLGAQKTLPEITALDLGVGQ